MPRRWWRRPSSATSTTSTSRPPTATPKKRLGPALEPYRKDVFLACKTQERTKTGAAAELQRSLEHLRTDHFDLYQFHAVTTMTDVETIFGPGGAMEAFLEAREKGQIRHIGFSAHSEAAALAMLDRFRFDTILYPVNWACWYGGDFGPKVVAKAQEQGVAILALKALAEQKWPADAVKKWYKCWYQPLDTPEEVAHGLTLHPDEAGHGSRLPQPRRAAVDDVRRRRAVHAAVAGGRSEVGADEQASAAALHGIEHRI